MIILHTTKEQLKEIETGRSIACRDLYLWVLVNLNENGVFETNYKDISSHTGLKVTGVKDCIKYLIHKNLLENISSGIRKLSLKPLSIEGLRERSHFIPPSKPLSEPLKKSIIKKDYSEELERLKDVWNNECCPPMAKLKAFNQTRINMFKKIRKDYSLDDIIMVARHMASQDFYLSKKDTPTAIDTLLRTTAFQSKFEIALSHKEKLQFTEKDRAALDLILEEYS
jgi:hypothetical protein